MHEPFDDSDMRIAGDHPSRELLADDHGDEAVRERENGNLERARQLGALMAGEVWSLDSENANPPESLQVAEQRRLLFAFAAAAGFDFFTPTPLCAHTALGSFYDTLGREAPALYEGVERSFAFSFYFLHLRREEHPAQGVGQTFAMLCGQEGDTAFIDRGAALYQSFLSIIRERANAMGFVPNAPLP